MSRSGGWAIAEYAVYPVLMIGAMPILLNALGAVPFGQWMLMLTFTGFGGVAALGMGPTATHDVAAARGANDAAGVRKSIRACLAVSIAAAAIFALTMGAVGLALAPGWFERAGNAAEIRQIVIFAAIILTFDQIDAVFAGAIKGLERFDLSAKLEIAVKVTQLIATLLIALAWRQLIFVFMASALFAVARTFLKMWVLRSLLGMPRLRPLWNITAMRQSVSYGRWIWVQGLGGLMFAVADRALIASFLGAATLGYYALILQLAQQVQAIPAAGAQVLFPSVARRRSAGTDWRSLAIRSTVVVAALGVVAATGLAVVGPFFLEIWLGQELAAKIAPLVPLLAVAYAVIALSIGPHHVLMGIGQAKTVAIWSSLAGIATIGVGALAIPTFGLAGAAGARVVYGFIILALLPALCLQISSRLARDVRGGN